MRNNHFLFLLALWIGLSTTVPGGTFASEAPAILADVETTPAAQTHAVEKLRGLIEKDLARYVTRKEDRPAVAAFYRDRGFALLWSLQSIPTAAAKEAVAYLKRVEADGLDPADYPTPDFADTAPDAQAENDLKLTASILAFPPCANRARELHAGQRSDFLRSGVPRPCRCVV